MTSLTSQACFIGENITFLYAFETFFSTKYIMIEFSLSASFRNLCKSSLQYPKNCSRQNENCFLVEEELSEFTKLKYFAYI
jgi:hypothetical protein